MPVGLDPARENSPACRGRREVLANRNLRKTGALCSIAFALLVCNTICQSTEWALQTICFLVSCSSEGCGGQTSP